MSSYTQIGTDIKALLDTITTFKGGTNYGVKQFESLGFPSFQILPLEDDSLAFSIGEDGQNQDRFVFRITIVDHYDNASTKEASMRSLVDSVRTKFRENFDLADPTNIIDSNIIGGRWGFTTDTQYRVYELDLEVIALLNR